jgi:uncharacterized membrane protein
MNFGINSDMRKKGMLGGFILGLLIVWLGFWNTVLICSIAFLGYFVGYMLEAYQEENKEKDQPSNE